MIRTIRSRADASTVSTASSSWPGTYVMVKSHAAPETISRPCMFVTEMDSRVTFAVVLIDALLIEQRLDLGPAVADVVPSLGDETHGALHLDLLVDDLVVTGWTLTLASRAVRRAGADAVLPLALALQA